MRRTERGRIAESHGRTRSNWPFPGWEQAIKAENRAIGRASQFGEIRGKNVQFNTAASKYGKWTVVGAEKIITEQDASKPTYELEVKTKGQRAEIVFDAAGALVKEEKSSAKG